MRVELHGGNELTITGNIKTIEDGVEIRKALGRLQETGTKSIVVRILDSFSITSTVIGLLMKLTALDKIHIAVIVGDQRLYRLLEELSLVQSFNVRMAGK